MRAKDWRAIINFKPSEFANPECMSEPLILKVDALREYVGRKVYVHCGYEKRKKFSYHNFGQAVDIHIEGLSLIEQFIVAQRFDFGGIGIYPWWNDPGLHLDVRPWGWNSARATWGSISPKLYVGVDTDFIKSL